ncbi:heterokaryon incompatibility, partial [Periconia macrospinosa]
YTAVSYCWGEATTSHVIKLNGRTFEVSDNLYQLLSVLRERKEKRWFWIDQICINQLDVEERNAQVSLMSFIYSSAEAVFAWLGSSTATTGLGFGMLARLEEDAAQFASEEDLTDEEKEGLRTVSELLSREYWTRLWIVQEVIYA